MKHEKWPLDKHQPLLKVVEKTKEDLLREQDKNAVAVVSAKPSILLTGLKFVLTVMT